MRPKVVRIAPYVRNLLLAALCLGAGTARQAFADTPHWQFVGPTNLQPAIQDGNGPGALAGRVNAVAIDPGHPGVYYAGAASGGV